MTGPREIRAFITQRDLEARWQLSGRTLERWRAEGYGPPWSVLGGSIRYHLGDVEAFEVRQRRGGPLHGTPHRSGGLDR